MLCIFLCLLAILTILWNVRINAVPGVTNYTLSSQKLPAVFSGFRIAQISDLHNEEFGEDNVLLLDLLREQEPDMIVITGDLIDSRNTDLEVALNFVTEAMKVAPCYFVTGNHEERVSEYKTLKEEMEQMGVVVLENEAMSLEREGESITLLGVDDPSFQTDYLFGDSESVMSSVLKQMTEGIDTYTILLSHRPELFEVYAAWEVDLVFSGHAHGGQFRLPWIGGLVAPNQGFFPKYDEGLFMERNTNMIVSRGLGDSILPLRINNPPELVIVELQAAD